MRKRMCCGVKVNVRIGSNEVPSSRSQVPCHLRSIRAISTVESMEVGTITAHGSQVLSPKYDMDVYMVTLFGGEVWDLI